MASCTRCRSTVVSSASTLPEGSMKVPECTFHENFFHHYVCCTVRSSGFSFRLPGREPHYSLIPHIQSVVVELTTTIDTAC